MYVYGHRIAFITHRSPHKPQGELMLHPNPTNILLHPTPGRTHSHITQHRSSPPKKPDEERNRPRPGAGVCQRKARGGKRGGGSRLERLEAPEEEKEEEKGGREMKQVRRAVEELASSP